MPAQNPVTTTAGWKRPMDAPPRPVTVERWVYMTSEPWRCRLRLIVSEDRLPEQLAEQKAHAVAWITRSSMPALSKTRMIDAVNAINDLP